MSNKQLELKNNSDIIYDNVSDSVSASVNESDSDTELKEISPSSSSMQLYAYHDPNLSDGKEESDLDAGIDSEIDCEYENGFVTKVGGAFNVNDDVKILNEFVVFRLLSSIFENIEVCVKRRKLLALYNYYSGNETWNDSPNDHNFTHFYKIEKYIGDRIRKKLIEYVSYYEVKTLIPYVMKMEIKMLANFDIQKMFTANTGETVPVYYLFH